MFWTTFRPDCGRDMSQAFLAAIFIYPVKSLEPLSCPQIKMLETGALEDDRRYGLFDAEGKFINGKRNAKVHHLRSSLELKTGMLRLNAEEFHIDRDRDKLEKFLSDFFAQPVFF